MIAKPNLYKVINVFSMDAIKYVTDVVEIQYRRLSWKVV
jgi:hypothetical protein